MEIPGISPFALEAASLWPQQYLVSMTSTSNHLLLCTVISIVAVTVIVPYLSAFLLGNCYHSQ